MARPTLSVVMPHYDHGAYVAEALGALTSQSVRPDEIIVVDDGSTDGGLAVIERIAASTPSIHVLRNERNLGVAAALARGLAVAHGDFVLSAAADDRILPGFFERSSALLRDHPSAGLCFTGFSFFDSDTGVLRPKHLGLSRRPTFFGPAELVDAFRRSGEDTIPGYGTLWRRDALLAIGGFRADLGWHCDWLAAFVLAFRFGACHDPAPLASFRSVPGAYSRREADRGAEARIVAKILALLDASECSDVRAAFVRSGVLSRFGRVLVEVTRAPALRHWRRDLPWRRVTVREAKNALIRIGPPPLRRAFWTVRGRWRRGSESR